MNRHRARPLVLFILALLLLSACAPAPAAAVQPALDVAAVYTAAAKTLQAQLTQSGGLAPTSTLAFAEAPTDTPVPATAATATELPTLTPMFTPTRPVFLITADETTNCRTGPGLDYEKVGSLGAGKTTQVYGTNELRTWFMIQNPGNEFEYCWVWDQTTTLGGDPYRIPFQPAPPMPTATATAKIDLRISFVGLNKCGSGKYAIFMVDNTSDATLHSAKITIVNQDKNQTVFGPEASDAPFLGSEAECPPGGDTIPAGEAGYVGGSVGSPVPHGSRMQAIIEICTENGLEGACLQEQVGFTAP